MEAICHVADCSQSLIKVHCLVACIPHRANFTLSITCFCDGKIGSFYSGDYGDVYKYFKNCTITDMRLLIRKTISFPVIV